MSKSANILPLGKQGWATPSIGVSPTSGECHDCARPNRIAKHHRSQQGVTHDHAAIHSGDSVAEGPESPGRKRNRARAQWVAHDGKKLRHIELQPHHVANRVDRSDRRQEQFLRHGEFLLCSVGVSCQRPAGRPDALRISCSCIPRCSWYRARPMSSSTRREARAIHRLACRH